mmetsp:Transcript_5227/g.12316  ORF Transcript_5227/g.12316 Transcript_5227/m.12316 type:complete len:203 (-) Transcript_5227:553-1161(-)
MTSEAPCLAPMAEGMVAPSYVMEKRHRSASGALQWRAISFCRLSADALTGGCVGVWVCEWVRLWVGFGVGGFRSIIGSGLMVYPLAMDLTSGGKQRVRGLETIILSFLGSRALSLLAGSSSFTHALSFSLIVGDDSSGPWWWLAPLVAGTTFVRGGVARPSASTRADLTFCSTHLTSFLTPAGSTAPSADTPSLSGHTKFLW